MAVSQLTRIIITTSDHSISKASRTTRYEYRLGGGRAWEGECACEPPGEWDCVRGQVREVDPGVIRDGKIRGRCVGRGNDDVVWCRGGRQWSHSRALA